MGILDNLGDAWNSVVDIFNDDESESNDEEVLWIEPTNKPLDPSPSGSSGGLNFVGPLQSNGAESKTPLMEDVDKIEEIFDREVEGMTER